MTAGFAFLQLSKKIRLKEILDQNLELKKHQTLFLRQGSLIVKELLIF
jgi:hypothetical protein